MNKKTLMIVAPLLVIILAGAGWMFLRPSPAAPVDETKAPGPVHTLGEPFLVNLADAGNARFVKTSVALRLAKSSAGQILPAEGSGSETVEDEPQVRDIIIRALKSRTRADLATGRGMDNLSAEIVRKINRETALKVLAVYYTELAVQ